MLQKLRIQGEKKSGKTDHYGYETHYCHVIYGTIGSIEERGFYVG
jgi:hypothetical protein